MDCQTILSKLGLLVVVNTALTAVRRNHLSLISKTCLVHHTDDARTGTKLLFSILIHISLGSEPWPITHMSPPRPDIGV